MWLLSVLAVIGAVTLVCWVAFASWNRERRIQSSVDEGMAAYERGDYVNALNILRYAVIHNQNDQDLILAFADSRLRNIDPKGKRGHVKSAIQHYEKVLDLDPTNQEALNALFKIHSKSGRINDALSTVKKLSVIDGDILLQKSRLEERSGDIENALLTLEELKSRDPADNQWVIAEYAVRQRMGSDPTEMLAVFDSHAEENPSNQSLDLVRLILLRRIGRADEAKEIAIQLIENDRVESDLLIDLRFQLSKLGLAEEFETINEQISEAAKVDPDLAFNLVQLDWRRGAIADAYEMATRSATNFDGDLRFLRSAILLHRLANPTGRDTVLEEDLIAQSNAMDTAGAILDKAIIALVESLDDQSEDTPIETLSHLARVRALDDSGSYFQFLVIFEGLMLEKSGHSKSAIEAYRIGFSRTNARLPGKLLVDAYIRNQEFDQAFTVSKKMNTLFPSVDSAELEYRTLLMLAKTGRNVLSVDVILNQAGSLSEAAKLQYDFWTQRSENATGLLPIIAESALIEENTENLSFAQAQALASAEILPEHLLRIAQMSKDSNPQIYEQLLDHAEDLGSVEFDIKITRTIDEEDIVKRVEGLMELEQLAQEMPVGSSERQDAYRRLLVQHAINQVDWSTKSGAIKALHRELTEDVPTANFILNIPDIWAKDPELASVSLNLLNKTLGGDSPAFVLADARRVLQDPDTDQRTRAMTMVAVDKVIRDSTESIEACLIMSSLLQSGTNPDLTQAVVYLRRVLDLRPDLVNLYPSAIALLQVTGDGALALEYLKQYRELVIKDNDIARLRATILAKQGDISNAVAEFSRLIEERGDLIDRVYLGGLLAQIEMNDEAIAQYDMVLEEDPENILALLRKATTLAAMGNEQSAIEVLDQNESLDADERLRYEILVHRSAGNVDSATNKVQELVLIAPDDIKSWLTMYEVYQVTDRLEERLEALDRVIALDPVNIDGLTYMALEYMSLDGMTEQSRKSIESLKDVLPARGEILELRLASTDPESGLLKPSSSQLKAAREILVKRPTSADANKLSWEMHKGVGDHASALVIAKNAISSLPSSIQPHQWAIESALAARYWDEAIEIAETARARLTPSERAMHDLKTAELCLALGYDSRAIRNLKRFLPVISDRELILEEAGSNARIPANYPEMMRMTALKALLAADRSQQAYELYKDMIRENTEMLDVWVLATSFTPPYEARRALQKVEPVLQETITGQIMLVKALLVIAEKSKEDSDIIKALDAINTVRTNDLASDELELDLYESTLLELYGRNDEAITILENMIMRLEQAGRVPVSSDGDSDVELYVTALNNLAYMYASHRAGGSDEASRSITKALAIAPIQYRGSLLDTKSLIDLKSGDCTGAESSIAQAIEMQPGNLEYRFRLLEVLIECAELTEAESTAILIQEQLLAAPQTDVEGLERISDMLEVIQTAEKMN